MTPGAYFLRLIWDKQYSYINDKNKVITPDLRSYYHSVQEFINYLDACSKIRMKYTLIDADFEKFCINTDYYNRYNDRYIRKLYAKLKRLEDWTKKNFNGYLTLMTLTVYQKKRTISECLDNLQEAKANLTHVLRKIREKVGFLEYIWVIEPHKTGYPHCHMILFTESDFKPVFETRLKKLWAEIYSAGSKKHGLHLGSDEGGNPNSIQVEYLGQYLFKYIAKSLTAINPAYLVFHAEIWKKYNPVPNYRKVEKRPDGKYKLSSAGRGVYRIWGCSRNLSKIMQLEDLTEEYDNCISVNFIPGQDNCITTFEKDNLKLAENIYNRKKAAEIAAELKKMDIQ